MLTPAGLGLAAGANSIWYGAFGFAGAAGALEAVSPISPQPARNANPLIARIMPLFMWSSVVYGKDSQKPFPLSPSSGAHARNPCELAQAPPKTATQEFAVAYPPRASANVMCVTSGRKT